jgi:hypothetical protein
MNCYYKRTRIFHIICSGKTFPKITGGKDWELKCWNHGNIKTTIICSAIDFCIRTLDTTMPLLTNPIFYPDRENIRDHSTKAFLPMVRYLYRMLAHIYYQNRKLFDLLEYRYRIAERLTLYCKKFNIIDKPKEYCIKI